MDDYKPHLPKKLKVVDSRAPVTPPVDQDYGDDGFIDMDDGDLPLNDPLPSSPVVKAVERKSHVTVKVEVEDADEEDLMEVAQADGITIESVNKSGIRPVPRVREGGCISIACQFLSHQTTD